MNVAETAVGATTPERARKIKAERIRVLFRAFSSREYIIGFSTISAAINVSLSYNEHNWIHAVVWVLIVAVVDFTHLDFDKRFRRANPPDEMLTKWGYGKAAFATLHGLGWTIGPMLLNTPGYPISTLAPAWGILLLTASSVYSSAAYVPALFGTMIAAILPASVWLFIYGTGIDFPIAVCMLASLPFACLLGIFSARNIDVLIENRLDIADLLEKQQAQTRIIQEANAERTRFFSAASHDLRQPLHALGFYVSLLNTAETDESRHEIVARISDCGSNLDRQFNAIMGIAETDSAIEHASVVPTALQKTIDRVVMTVKPEAGVQRLDLRVVKTNLTVLADSDLLERVLINLVTNAIRYTRTGGVLVGVRRRADTAMICVVDTGIGIAPEAQQRIFDDFYQVENSERSREKGFGLGLAIVRRLCTGMEWPLLVASTPGRGSIFSVTVPITTATPLAALPETQASEPMALRGMNILFVDDDSLVRDAMIRMLEKWGVARIVMCGNGSQALQALEGEVEGANWHALIDHRLAFGETGLVLAERIRAAHGDKVRITLVTGETDQSVLDEAQRRGINILRKPLKPIRLRALLSVSAQNDAAQENAATRPI